MPPAQPEMEKHRGGNMKRREAREQAFALIFARSINRDTTREIIEAAGEAEDVPVDDFAAAAAAGVEENEAELDGQIEHYTRGWTVARLSKVSLSVLRLAVYEILYEKDIPVSVSINEAVELAKKYGDAEDAPFVNGILGSLARKLAEGDA